MCLIVCHVCDIHAGLNSMIFFPSLPTSPFLSTLSVLEALLLNLTKIVLVFPFESILKFFY